ncbi:MAG: DNA methyltransferase, partial [Planctomycetota bacterium]
METDRVIQTDCIAWMKDAEPFADLVFADPPFNIGYQYDVYEDKLAYQEYYDWTFEWMEAAAGILRPTGSLWVAIGAEYAAEIRMIGRQL